MPLAKEIYYFASKGGAFDRPPVVLIHGAGGDHLHWPHNIRRLPGHRVFALDLPGHGKSAGLGRQTISAYAKDIVDWLDEIDIYRAIFIGHSMGGAIAQVLALEHSDRVLGLGLVATGAKLGVNPSLLEKLSVPATFPIAVELILNWSYAEGTPKKHIATVKEQLLTTRPSVMYGDYLACDRFNVMEAINKIEVPTTVICGREDRMTPLKYAKYLVEHIPNAHLTVIPDSGHMVMQEKPQAVAKALEAFVGNVPYCVVK